MGWKKTNYELPGGLNGFKKRLPKYHNEEIRKKIGDLIHDEKDRELLTLKLIDGFTLEAVAEKQNRAYSTVRDHYYQQIKVLFPEYPDL